MSRKIEKQEHFRNENQGSKRPMEVGGFRFPSTGSVQDAGGAETHSCASFEEVSPGQVFPGQSSSLFFPSFFPFPLHLRRPHWDNQAFRDPALKFGPSELPAP